MNWDAIGAIGEIVGALAVVVSLAYLGTQIRISNRASRQTAEQHLIDVQKIWLGRISDSESLADIWIKGSKNDSALSESEWIRYGALCNEITLNWERSFLLGKDGDVSSLVLDRDSRQRRIVINSPGYRKWFAARKETLTEEFADLIEMELEEVPAYTVPYASGDAGANET